MGQFLKKCIIFVSLTLFFVTIMGNNKLYKAYRCHETTDWGRFSTAYCENEQYDVLMFGSSHVALIPDFLDKKYPIKVKTFNNSGGGVEIQRTYLKYFINQKNKTDKILYCVDPFMLYSDKWDTANHLIKGEFNFSFFFHLVKNMGLSFAVDYLTSFECIGEGKPIIHFPNPRTQIDSSQVERRLNDLYSDHRIISERDIIKQKAKFIETIEYLKKYDLLDKVTLCVLPTLLGPKEPLKMELQDFLIKLEEIYDVPHFNFADIYYHPDTYVYFNDHDHLNVQGTEIFVKEHLLPIIDKKLLIDTVQ